MRILPSGDGIVRPNSVRAQLILPRGVTNARDCDNPILFQDFVASFALLGLIPALPAGVGGALGITIGAVTVPGWVAVGGAIAVTAGVVYGIHYLFADELEDLQTYLPLICEQNICKVRSLIKTILELLGLAGAKPVAVVNNRELTRQQIEDIAKRRCKPDHDCCEDVCTAMAYGDRILDIEPWRRPEDAGWCDTPGECYENCVSACNEAEIGQCMGCSISGIFFAPFCS